MANLLLVINVVGMLLGVALVLESFRSEPMWPHPEKWSSPRQRRRLGFGLIVIVSGGFLNWFGLVGDGSFGLAAAGLYLAGLLVMAVGMLKGPTDAELERRERLLARDD